MQNRSIHSSSPEVSDIIRTVSRKVSFNRYDKEQRKILTALKRCRTSELGGHVTYCTKCDYKEQSYNSCLNRHCPKCKGGKVFDWVQSRQSELLPVRYFHLVFTIPSELRGIFYQNKKLCYDLLFKASSEALNEIAASKHEVRLGYFGVLHTWNQELLYHPHIHYVVPAGGLNSNKQWQPIGTDKFFLPVRALSKVFQGKLIYYLKKEYSKGTLKFFHSLSHLENPRDFEHQMSKATKTDWVVYAKRPFAGPDTVIKYLSSYTHRVGISNRRIVSLTEESVRFTARHKTKKDKKIVISISPEEFVRRFLLHTIQKDFRRVRYFGFLINSQRSEAVSTIRQSIDSVTITQTYTITPTTCPRCHCLSLRRQPLLKPHRNSSEIPQNHGWHPPNPLQTSNFFDYNKRSA